MIPDDFQDSRENTLFISNILDLFEEKYGVQDVASACLTQLFHIAIRTKDFNNAMNDFQEKFLKAKKVYDKRKAAEKGKK
jgi:hypothetical protein